MTGITRFDLASLQQFDAIIGPVAGQFRGANALIDAIKAGKRNIGITPGIYNFYDGAYTVDPMPANVHLYGLGNRDDIQLIGEVASTSWVGLSAGISRFNNISFIDIGLWGLAGQDRYFDNCTFKKVNRITDPHTAGWGNSLSDKMHMTNCEVIGGRRFELQGDQFISNNHFAMQESYTVLDIEKTDNAVFEANRLINCGFGGISGSHIRLVNNIITDTSGIYKALYILTGSSNVVIDGNTIDLSGGNPWGIITGAVTDLTLVNNQITMLDNWEAIDASSVVNGLFANNRIKNCGARAGIIVRGGDNISFFNNQFIGTTGDPLIDTTTATNIQEIGTH